MTVSDASIAAEGAVVETDVPCPCGYNLRGLPRAGRCPECALPVEEGLRRFDEPFDANQLRRVASGIGFMLIAHAGWLVTALALAPNRGSFWASALLGVAGPTTFLTMMQVRHPQHFAIPVALVLTSLLWVAGVWQVATPSRPRWGGPNLLARSTRYVTFGGWLAACAAFFQWEDVMAAASLGYDAVAAALLWAYLIRLTKHAGLERLSAAAWWVGGMLVAAKLVFASNIDLGFHELMFWIVIDTFAAAGLIASLFLIFVRRAANRPLLPYVPTAAGGTACGSP